MIGTQVGNYRVVRQIGEGGMGAVFLAEHVMIGREAAIKVLLPELSHNREVVTRFFNEARAAAALRHPAIVEIYDVGYTEDGAAYIAMELLAGESLAARLRRMGVLPVATAIDLVRQIAIALGVAHAKDITHRDLKPDNVFLTPDPELGERAKLLDFGIAKLAGGDPVGTRTRTGAVLGTPVYMSPEQCRGSTTLDVRSDLYSLGCVMYELVAGRPPFVGDSAGDIIAHHLYFEPELVRRVAPHVPEPIAELITSLLAKDPANRPASAARVVELLDSWSGRFVAATTMVALPSIPTATPVAALLPTTLSGSTGATTTPPARRRSWIAAAVVVAGAAAVVLVVVRPSDNSETTSTPATIPVARDASERVARVVPAPPDAAAPASTATLSPPPLPPPIAPAPQPPRHAPSSPPPTAPERRATPVGHATRPVEREARVPPPSDPVPLPSSASAPPPPDASVDSPVAAVPPSKDPPTTPATSSKWGRRLGDKTPASLEVDGLIEQCRTAAARGDCVAARSIAARIHAKDPTSHATRVVGDPSIRTCLTQP